MDQYNSINQTNSGKAEYGSPSITRAEHAVTQSVERFEQAIQHLADRVEESRLRVENAVEQVNRARTEAVRIKESVVGTIEPFKPYVQQVGATYTAAKENPKPYLLSILGIVGALLAWTYYQGRQETKVYDTTLEVHPTYQ